MANSFRNELSKHKIGQWEWQHRIASRLWCSEMTGFNKDARKIAKMILALLHERELKWRRIHKAREKANLERAAQRAAQKAAQTPAPNNVVILPASRVDRT